MGSCSGCIVAVLHWFFGCGSARCVDGRLLIGEPYIAVPPGVLAAAVFATRLLLGVLVGVLVCHSFGANGFLSLSSPSLSGDVPDGPAIGVEPIGVA